MSVLRRRPPGVAGGIKGSSTDNSRPVTLLGSLFVSLIYVLPCSAVHIVPSFPGWNDEPEHTMHCNSVLGQAPILQLPIMMFPSPELPSHDEVERDGGFRQFRHDPLEFAERRDEGPQTAKHSVGLRSVGLVSFGLAAALRHCAVSLARNAAAAMTRVIWRCHPCQERASQ